MSQFVDTNILVYAVSDGSKQEIARRVLAEGGLISVQVLNEFTAVMRRKYQRSWADIAAAIGVFRVVFPTILPVTMTVHESARQIASQHGLTIYDALIVATALDADCRVLISEDLQAGRAFGSLVISNPFSQ